jgi:hypothetical protein
VEPEFNPPRVFSNKGLSNSSREVLRTPLSSAVRFRKPVALKAHSNKVRIKALS